jgi:hypothetical protein
MPTTNMTISSTVYEAVATGLVMISVRKGSVELVLSSTSPSELILGHLYSSVNAKISISDGERFNSTETIYARRISREAAVLAVTT